MAKFFACSALVVFKLLKIKKLMVEAAGVERFFHKISR